MKEKIEQMIERYACENTPDVWQKIAAGTPAAPLPEDDHIIPFQVKKPHKWIPMAACLCIALVAVVAYKMQLDNANQLNSSANGLLAASSASMAAAGEAYGDAAVPDPEQEISMDDLAPQAPQYDEYKTAPETGGAGSVNGGAPVANNIYSNAQTGGRAVATAYDYQLAYDIVHSLKWFEGYDVVSVDVTDDEEFPNVMYLDSEDASVKVYLGADALLNESLNDFTDGGYAKVQLEEVDQSDGYSTILVCVAGEPLTLKMSEEDCLKFAQIAQP